MGVGGTQHLDIFILQGHSTDRCSLPHQIALYSKVSALPWPHLQSGALGWSSDPGLRQAIHHDFFWSWWLVQDLKWECHSEWYFCWESWGQGKGLILKLIPSNRIFAVIFKLLGLQVGPHRTDMTESWKKKSSPDDVTCTLNEWNLKLTGPWTLQ